LQKSACSSDDTLLSTHIRFLLTQGYLNVRATLPVAFEVAGHGAALKQALLDLGPQTLCNEAILVVFAVVDADGAPLSHGRFAPARVLGNRNDD
jgi:hypothetical protein